MQRNTSTKPRLSPGSKIVSRKRPDNRPSRLVANTLRRRPVARRISRRRFIAGAAGAGALAAALPSRGFQVSWSRDLFFNFAYLPNHDNLTLVVAGRRHRLTKTAEDPSVLARARRTNSFLAQVPTHMITHHLQGLVLSSDICSLAFAQQPIESSDGTWQMTGIVQLIPEGAQREALSRMRRLLGSGPFPLSAKRRKYGMGPALVIEHVLDEQVLIDSTDHARTLIAMHPDMLSAEPVSASYVKGNYIEPDIGTLVLGNQIESLGPAQPQSVSTSGWATLVPLTQSNGQPYKMQNGQNQYAPDFNSTIDPLLSNSVNTLHPQVKNDTSLGANVTGAAPPTQEGTSPFGGNLWFRNDGVAGVARNLNRSLDATPVGPQLQEVDGSTGLVVSQPGITNNADGSVTLSLNNVANWFLRFLGMYIQFIDPNDMVIPFSKLNRDDIFSANSDVPISGLDLSDSNTYFGGILSPPFAVAGIPVYPGGYSIKVQFPTAAKAVKIYYGTIGFNGSEIGPSHVKDLGLSLTVAINYGLVAFFMGIGVSGIDPIVKLLTGIAGQIIAQELVLLIGAEINSTGVNIFTLGLAFIKGLLGGLAGKGLAAIIGLIYGYVTEATAESMIPVAGVIARVAAAIIGGVQLVETTIEAGLSPPVYEFDIVRNHDVTVTIYPDPSNNTFPQVPTGYTLYYKVSYLFDDASPHYLPPVPLAPPYPASIPVVLTDLPQGGKLNVSVGFYAQVDGQPPSMNDWCAAKGTTGLQDNVSTPPLSITIQQFKIPIQQGTVYTHKAITVLDSTGNHHWMETATPPAYIEPTGGNQAGSLGALRAITVRQGTSTQQGYVGYAWQGYSSALASCASGARAQLDQAANLNTNPASAQSGYSHTPCGQQGGASSGMKLTYSLLTDDQANFFLDTNSLLIRQITLANPPTFNNPSSGMAWGKLNLASTSLLLHPAGHLVSINNISHKMETLKLPPGALDPTVAQAGYLARAVSGQGSRPGLMTLPVASAITPDGVLLVLEDSSANNRLQAFDLGGNPIKYFSQQPTEYFLELPATANATYLDLAVEFSGFLYILARDSSGVFRLDIYHPGQSNTQPISTSYNINGAKLCVDFWRTVYTLNYQVLQLPNGNYPGLTEPSVSSWLPSLPPSTKRRGGA